MSPDLVLLVHPLLQFGQPDSIKPTERFLDPDGMTHDVEVENGTADMCSELRTLFTFLPSFPLIVFVICHDSHGTRSVYEIVQDIYI